MADTGTSDTVKREEDVLVFWKENRTFEKTLAKQAPKGEFVFYDGPPFATGLPHMGSLLSSVIKDVVPRYKTMRGYRVPRVWGWDCHGLPIESLIEKRLELKTKKDILTLGVEKFNAAAKASVLEFEHEWEKYVDRIGRWVDFKNSYKTMDNAYIEAVWWSLKNLYEKDLLYEGRKVLMYCPHCETPLAKAEIAMDNTYKDITEEAVTVKFKVTNPEKIGLSGDVYLLAWTTTPWTLPGNVGLAVGKDIAYGLGEGNTIAAKDGGAFTGAQLVGLAYEPLFDVPALKSEASYKVYAADFVHTEEGTGIVHTAVMYGEDDFALGQKVGLPMVQMLDAGGHFNDAAPEFIRGQYLKKAEKAIKEDLETRGLLFARAHTVHSYPHCYRCGTPLIYNAVASWFVNIQKVKAKMLSENEKITWVPEHLKHGRFKHIVENAPDWTISRNRFWASPLPIWKEKGGDGLMVIGSVEELKQRVKKSGNRYVVMRHGEARGNADGILDSDGDETNGLTENGKRGVIASARQLPKADVIFASPLKRARETAAHAAEVMGMPASAVVIDERLREVGLGIYSGKTMREWKEFYGSLETRMNEAPDGSGGESFTDVRRRVGDFLTEIERTYSGKTILIVSHGNPIWSMASIASGISQEQLVKDGEILLATGEARELPFTPLPYDGAYYIDLHRPYTDTLLLVDDEGREYERIPEVVDCWVESGAMPVAQHHTLGAPIVKPPVADFIAEYIAQTRTWFYYMHALGVALFNRRAFDAVVSTGTILTADGSKMSKSKNNYTDPLVLMNQYGADAVRYALMQSVVMQSEDLSFRDDDVKEAHNRVIGLLWNSFKFFELYKSDYDGKTSAHKSPHVLDRWIMARLRQLIEEVTAAMDAYDLPRAMRPVRTFIDDYSTWYLRRSRDRVKGEASADTQHCLATQRHVLGELAKLLAPVMPFIAENIWQGIGGTESVHLQAWPEAGRGFFARWFAMDAGILQHMENTRAAVSHALEAREKAGIKIRQPLRQLTVDSARLPEEYLALIRDEVNVKKVVFGNEVVLDTNITPELREEGIVRELVRRIQGWRKEQGLTIADRPVHTLAVQGEEKQIAKKHKAALMRETGLADLVIDDA